MNTVLWILYIILVIGGLVQSIRAEIYKRRAEDAEAEVLNMTRQVHELRVWVENNFGKGTGNKTDGNE